MNFSGVTATRFLHLFHIYFYAYWYLKLRSRILNCSRIWYYSYESTLSLFQWVLLIEVRQIKGSFNCNQTFYCSTKYRFLYLFENAVSCNQPWKNISMNEIFLTYSLSTINYMHFWETFFVYNSTDLK